VLKYIRLLVNLRSICYTFKKYKKTSYIKVLTKPTESVNEILYLPILISFFIMMSYYF